MKLIVHKPAVNPHWVIKGTYVVSIDEKREWILENEYQLAGRLSREIIHRPELNIWMIIIPVIFVYFFFQLNRSVSAKKEFVQHFVFTRKNILNEAHALSENEDKPDFEEMAKNERVPDCAVKAYENLANVLFEHYHKLLQAEGDSYEDLLISAYGQSKSLLAYIKQLGSTEKALNIALRPELEKSSKEVPDVISSIERYSEKFRESDARELFS